MSLYFGLSVLTVLAASIPAQMVDLTRVYRPSGVKVPVVLVDRSMSSFCFFTWHCYSMRLDYSGLKFEVIFRTSIAEGVHRRASEPRQGQLPLGANS